MGEDGQSCVKPHHHHHHQLWKRGSHPVGGLEGAERWVGVAGRGGGVWGLFENSCAPQSVLLQW